MFNVCSETSFIQGIIGWNSTAHPGIPSTISRTLLYRAYFVFQVQLRCWLVNRGHIKGLIFKAVQLTKYKIKRIRSIPISFQYSLICWILGIKKQETSVFACRIVRRVERATDMRGDNQNSMIRNTKTAGEHPESIIEYIYNLVKWHQFSPLYILSSSIGSSIKSS